MHFSEAQPDRDDRATVTATSGSETHGGGGFDNEFCRHLLEHAGVAVVATDRELTIRLWNAAAGRLLGASGALVIGTTIQSVFPARVRRDIEQKMRTVLETGEKCDVNFQHPDEHGADRELLSTFSPVRATDGEIIGVSAFIRDITRRIHLQVERDQNRKMSALGQMAGAIAHYFNNILGGVITSIDFAIDSANPGLYGRVLRQSASELNRATLLLRALLCFAEGNRSDEDLGDLMEVLALEADSFQNSCAESGIEFELTVDGTMPIVPVPRAQVQTVLQHVMQNSIEAMPDGGRLNLAVEVDRDTMVIRVKDTGSGIAREDLARIFEPFWTTKSALYGGSHPARGLGLAIAHGIVHMLGGTIVVESSIGKGTAVTIRLPSDAATR